MIGIRTWKWLENWIWKWFFVDLLEKLQIRWKRFFDLRIFIFWLNRLRMKIINNFLNLSLSRLVIIFELILKLFLSRIVLMRRLRLAVILWNILVLIFEHLLPLSLLPFLPFLFFYIIVWLFLFSLRAGIIFDYKGIVKLKCGFFFFLLSFLFGFNFTLRGCLVGFFGSHTNGISVIVDDFLFRLILKKSCKINISFSGLPIFIDFWFLNYLCWLVYSWRSFHDNLFDFRFFIFFMVQILRNSRRIWIYILLL